MSEYVSKGRGIASCGLCLDDFYGCIKRILVIKPMFDQGLEVWVHTLNGFNMKKLYSGVIYNKLIQPFKYKATSITISYVSPSIFIVFIA